MKAVWEAANFLSSVRRRLRFGELSRQRLQMLRLEVRGECVECEWMARPADTWDEHLPVALREKNQALQALRDAMRIRELLFDAFPGARSAKLFAYRKDAKEDPELIVTGTVTREDEAPPRVPSLVMRAKLCGFRFLLTDGVLKSIA